MALQHFVIDVPYIPRPDPEALNWLESFYTTLEPKPSAFGVDERDVASLGGYIRDFREKLDIVARVAARPLPAISDKVSEKIRARNAAVQAVESIVWLIWAHPLNSEEDFALLGLPPQPPAPPARPQRQDEHQHHDQHQQRPNPSSGAEPS